MSAGEQAVKGPGQKKFHRLKPGALIGTVRCGAGMRSSGLPVRWLPVAGVLPSQQCRECWKRAGA